MNAPRDHLRDEARRHRDRIEPSSEPLERAVELFFEHINPAPAQSISFYWPLGREFDPGGIMEVAFTRGHDCLLPVIMQGARILKFARWRDGEPLVRGPMGIMQPVQDGNTIWMDPDIVVVPLLAFDRRGHRLGYGGGYYDATLRDLRARKQIIAAGIAYAQQAVLFALPAEQHDEPLDWVITPQEAHRFSAKG